MKIVTSQTMRTIDHRTMEEYDVSGYQLMDRAGLAVAEEVLHASDRRGAKRATVQLLAGRGNNGGDAFAAARYLKEAGLLVEVFLAGAGDDVRGDARTHLDAMRDADIPLHELATKEEWTLVREELPPAEIIVDGLLGTGTKGPARGPVAGAIEYIRHAGPMSFIIAIDVPSGVDPDTGDVHGAAVEADITITMGLPKRGLLESAVADHVGQLLVADLGFPQEVVDSAPGDPECEAIHSSDLFRFFRRRPYHAHKGTFGHALIIGGARTYPGAIALAGRAALRSGAGLVSVIVPAAIAPSVSQITPELIVHGVAENEHGSLAAKAWDDWVDRMPEYSSVLAGPGMTRHPDTRVWIEGLLTSSHVPLVLDADALNVFAGEAEQLKRAQGELVITPHPGEFHRLFGHDVAAVQRARVTHARKAADLLNATVVLKGARTVVASPGASAHINLTGNPGMATAGSGDVLAGMLAALLAQGFNPLDAARSAVYVHGMAGDQAAWNSSQIGLIASDIIEELPHAFNHVSWG